MRKEGWGKNSGPTDICRVWSSGGQGIGKGDWARVCRLTDHPWRKTFEERMVPSVKCYRRVRGDGDEKAPGIAGRHTGDRLGAARLHG